MAVIPQEIDPVKPDARCRPLFILLKREFWEAFRDGVKVGMEEFRPYGRRWNERTCFVGRRVILSLGYNGPRLMGVIERFRVSLEPTRTEAWASCGYAQKHPGVPAACIRIPHPVPCPEPRALLEEPAAGNLRRPSRLRPRPRVEPAASDPA